HRHVHLNPAAMERLFGRGLTPLSELSQPGRFAATETVSIVGPLGRIEKVRVVGPLRDKIQVEISGTDQFTLGVQAPVRESGNLDGTPGIELEGPAGKMSAANGLIRALRHIHMLPGDADEIGVKDGARVSVRLVGDRATVAEGVLVRVSSRSSLEMHIDTDEANAAGIPAQSVGQILLPLMAV
ncbi:MAG TPA: phosphate propanoyltransferase, partial [Spirochaetia bacterium]